MMRRIVVQFQPGTPERILQLFGRKIEPIELAQAVGALSGAVVTFAIERGQLVANVTHEWVDIQVRNIFQDENKELIICNRALRKSAEAPTGFGIQMFRTQVEAAQRLGVWRITTFAAGSPAPGDYNGYYTWARFGFEASLDEYEIDTLPLSLAPARTLNEVMLLGGQRWWKAAGRQMEMVFELDENSSMMRVFKRYLAELRQQGRLAR